MKGKNLRVMVAKPGLDGHDRGAKVVAHLLKDSGFDVIYTGLHKSVEQIVEMAIQEDVDVIGLSVMTGGHMPITEKLMQKLREQKVDDILVTVGGVISRADVEKLKGLGASAVFPGGTKFKQIVDFFKEEAPKLRKAV